MNNRSPGAIEISRSENESEVSVDIVLKEAGYLDWSVSQNGDLIAVTCKSRTGVFEFPGGFSLPGARFDAKIKVPKQSILDLANRWGEISVIGVEGTSINAESNVGSIHIAGFDGTTDARTKTGLVNLENVSGRISARNSAGSISYTGRVSGDSSFTTKVGNIDITLFGELDLRIDASSRVGSVSIDPSIKQAQLQSEMYGISNHVSSTIGSGTFKLFSETLTGTTSIRHSPLKK